VMIRLEDAELEKRFGEEYAAYRERVRHPVYLGHLCEMLAWSIGTGLVVCWALLAFAMITGVVMIRLEDAELEKRFGEEYAAYRERVPAVLPKGQE